MISFEFDLKLRQIYYSFDTQSGSLHKQLNITNVYPFAYVLPLSLEIKSTIQNWLLMELYYIARILSSDV